MAKSIQPQSEELASNLGLLNEEVYTHSHDLILSNMTIVTITGGGEVMAAPNASQVPTLGQGDLT